MQTKMFYNCPDERHGGGCIQQEVSDYESY